METYRETYFYHPLKEAWADAYCPEEDEFIKATFPTEDTAVIECPHTKITVRQTRVEPAGVGWPRLPRYFFTVIEETKGDEEETEDDEDEETEEESNTDLAGGAGEEANYQGT